MERSAFALLEGMESSWWYRGRAAVVQSVLNRFISKRDIQVLDFGAGYGGMHTTLAAYGKVSAYEPDEEVCRVLNSRGYTTVYDAASTALGQRSYDLVALFDVLEHIKDDRALLHDARGALAPGGRLLLTVPAFGWLWSAHDTEHHHYRRYTRTGLRALLAEVGYEVEYASYWNCALFVPAALMRLAGRGGESGLTPPRLVNAFLTTLIVIEAAILKYVPLPFGLSLIIVAHAANTAEHRHSKLIAKIKFLSRYGISGLTAGVVQTAVLYIWVSVLHLEAAYLWGAVIGFIIALATGFLLQKYWTFRDHSSQRVHTQAISYTAIALVSLGLNVTLLHSSKLLAESVGLDFFSGWYLVAQIFAIGVTALASFFANYFITFRKR